MSRNHEIRQNGLNRRTLVKGAAGAAAGASALTTAIAQASTGNAGFYVNRNQDQGELNVMYLYVPFMEAIIPEFEEETGIKVNTVSTYASNDEWWAKLNSGAQTDFLIGTTDWVQRAMAADLLQPLDLDALSNLDTLLPDFQKNEVYIKDGDSYAVPWTRVYYCLTYNTDTFSGTPTSWDVTWDSAYEGQISLMDQGQARIGTTALYLGQDPMNPDDWDAIREALLEQKPLVEKYWHDYQNGMEIFANEEAVVGQLTAGRTRMALAEGAAINWTVPEEGCLTFIDTFVVPEVAENVEQAHKLIDFLIRPDIMAREMEMMYYDTLSAEVADKLPDDIKPMFELPENAKLPLAVDVPASIRQQWDQLWTEVKLS